MAAGQVAPASTPVAAVTSSATVHSDAEVSAEFDKLISGLDVTGSAEAGGTPAGSDLITEDEFDDLLDQLHGPHGAPGGTPASAAAPVSDLITEDEFDSLLDSLHGPNGAPGLSQVGTVDNSADAEFDQLLGGPVHAAPAADSLKPVATAPSVGGDLITDDEFEHLLDDLQSKGHWRAIRVC